MPQLESKYDISVIIPTYNRADLLDYTLNSLLLQEPSDVTFETIVADDGSTDNTRDICRRYESAMPLKYLYQENLGYRPASARNLASLNAEGEICLLIDSGVLLNNNCVLLHQRFHQRMGRKAAAVGYVYGFEKSGDSIDRLNGLIDPLAPHESIEAILTKTEFKDIRDYHYVNYKDEIQDLPAPWIYFWTCHVSAYRSDLFNVGLFDESYNGRWGCEDNDLGLRLHQSGTLIHLLRAAKSIHLPHHENWTKKKKEGYENCKYFHQKFQTIETRLFLDTYMNNIFTDVNAMTMQIHYLKNVMHG